MFCFMLGFLFQIFVNGRYFCDFCYRVEKYYVNILMIEGGVQIYSIWFDGVYSYVYGVGGFFGCVVGEIVKV